MYYYLLALTYQLEGMFFFESKVKSKVGHCSRGQPEGSLFNSYYTEVLGRTLLLSQDCSTLPSIRTLYHWVFSKEVSSTIFKVFGMMWPGIEPRSLRPLANILPLGQWASFFYSTKPLYLVFLDVQISENSCSFYFCY